MPEEVNPEVAKRILKKILVKENMNLNQKTKTDREMVKEIQNIIQTEVKSYSPAN